MAKSIILTNDTIKPEVLFQKRERTYTDRPWAFLYVLNIIAFLTAGFVILANASVRFTHIDQDLKIISPAFENDLQECCDSISSTNDTSLCDYLKPTNSRERRRLEDYFFDSSANSMTEEQDAYDSIDFASDDDFSDDDIKILKLDAGKLEKNQGIFDTFLDIPGVLVGLVVLAITTSVLWVVFLRYFSKTAVFGTEVVKVSLIVWYAVASAKHSSDTATMAIIIAILVASFAIWKRKRLEFAAKTIKQSTVAMKENPNMLIGVLFIIILYVFQAFLFVTFFTKGYENVEIYHYTVDDDEAIREGCSFRQKSYVGGMQTFLCLSWLWSIMFFNSMRLYIIASSVGSWHFHPKHRPTIWITLQNSFTTSFGSISIAALVTAMVERLKRYVLMETCQDWTALFCCCMVVGPLKLILCCFGACLDMVLKAWTKFAVICHAFTGLSFTDSGEKSYKILSRHFEGGFVTEYSSKSTLYLGAYALGISFTFITWAWVDDAVDVGSLKFYTDHSSVTQLFQLIMWIVFLLFNLYYPALGLYLIIFIDKMCERYAGHNNQYWVSPLAASFVGCMLMLFFQYMAGLILDVVDVLFFCFAVDKDNNKINKRNKELFEIVKENPGYIAVPADDLENPKTKDELVVTLGVEPVKIM